jgi:putative redox protein
MSEILVRHVERDRFRIEIRGHEIDVDQPVEDGGDDKAPTPTELLVAALASCVAFYAGRYLRRHDLSTTGLEVGCTATMAEGRPARVTSMDVRLRLPAGFPDERRAGLKAVVEHCTVHNTLVDPPDVAITLDGR